MTSASPLASVQVGNGGTIITSAAALGASPAPTSQAHTSAVTTTDSSGNAVVLSGTSDGQVITTTDARGSTVALTYTPGGGAVSELQLITTRLPNGAQSTITSFAIIGGNAATTTLGGAASSESASGTHHLQSQGGAAAIAPGFLGAFAAAVAGLVGLAAVLL